MHITVYCPRCHQPWHVEERLRGKAMRCPNPVCREVFIVMESSQPAAPDGPSEPPPSGEDVYGVKPDRPREPDPWRPPQGTPQSGSVSDFVPLVEAEAVEQFNPDVEPPRQENLFEGIVPQLPAEAEDQPPQEAAWNEPPPVRKQSAPAPAPRPEPPRKKRKPDSVPVAEPAPPPPTVPAAEVKTSPDGPTAPQPVELSPGAWEAPPVRRGAGTTDHEAPPPAEPPPIDRPLSEYHPEHEPAAPTARRRARWIIGSLLLILLVVVGTFGYLIISAGRETEAALQAQALDEYHNGHFDSATNRFHSLLQKYPESDDRRTYEFMRDLSDIRARAAPGLESKPLEAYDQVAHFLETRKSDDPLLQSHRDDVFAALTEIAGGLIAHGTQQLDEATLKKAEGAIARAVTLNPEGNVRPLRDKLLDARQALARQELRKQLLAEGQHLAESGPTTDSILAWVEKVRSAKLDEDPEFRNLRTALDKAVLGRVRYVEVHTPLHPDDSDEEPEHSVRVAALVGGPAKPPPPGDQVVLALVNGVLYGLAQGNGEVHWTRRVGIDTTRLPLRLPATQTSPERLLVLSADRNTLTAVDAHTGRMVWRHQLESPCLGLPVVVGGRAYVPTYQGRVNEIEIYEGNLLGYFELGQPLTVGGVWQEGTNLLYFPAESQNVFVLSIPPNGPRSCVAVLQTGHASGSLRSEPLLITRTEPQARGAGPGSQDYLILTLADGLTHLKLRVQGVPVLSPNAPPLAEPERVRGWSWFRPYHDSEKVAFVTDAGVFSLFGVNQLRNEDKPLFPELPEEFRLQPAGGRSERAQVVHAGEDDFWVLANGDLQRLHFDRYRQRMVKVWPRPLPLGAPIHSAQVDGDERGQVLFVVTQSPGQPAYFATAVDAEKGTILWQRQLGLQCHDDPLVIQGKVVALDQGGSLFLFDPEKVHHRDRQVWRTGGELLARPVADGAVTPDLLPGPDGASAYEVAYRGRDRQLLVRRYPGEEKAKPHEYRLDSPPAGTFAVGRDALVLPLANGKLYRQPLDGSKPGTIGLDWRSPGAEENARGHVVGIDGERFLVTNGSRGLMRILWTAGDYSKEQEATLVEGARIVAAPVVLRREGGAYDVAVADAEGRVTLLEGATLKPRRSWTTGGTITAGPFLRGRHVGLVVDRSRLVWVDPAQDKPLWEYAVPGEGVVGQPQFVAGLLVVADLSGRIVALDPATGQPAGPPYTLKASAAPAAAPVPFGPDRLFVPLTDGTVVLLPLGHLRHPLADWPVP